MLFQEPLAVPIHRPQLEDLHGLSVLPDAFLDVEGRAWVNEFDHQRRQGHRWQDQEPEGNSDQDIERPFQHSVLPRAEVAPDLDADHRVYGSRAYPRALNVGDVFKQHESAGWGECRAMAWDRRQVARSRKNYDFNFGP